MVEALKSMSRHRNYVIANFAAVILFITFFGARMTLIPLYGEELVGLSRVEIGLLSSIAEVSGVVILLGYGFYVDEYIFRDIRLVYGSFTPHDYDSDR